MFQPKQNAKIAVKRFICFSQSQPVYAQVIVPSPAAGLARKQLIATVLSSNSENVSLPELFQNSFD